MREFNINKEDPLPLYVQLQREIIKKINNDEYPEHTALPAEHVIIKNSGLSRTTVRQAIDNLEKEGYIEKKRGIGTFVCTKQKRTWNLEALRSFREEFSMKGQSSKTKLLEIKKIQSDPILVKVFEGHQSFYKLERLRFVDDIPIILVTTYVPSKLVPKLEAFNLDDNSLFGIMMNDYGVEIGYAEKEFRAKKVTSHDAKILEIEENSPIQEVTTTTYDIEGTPIEFSISRDRGDISVYKIRLNHTTQKKN